MTRAASTLGGQGCTHCSLVCTGSAFPTEGTSALSPCLIAISPTACPPQKLSSALKQVNPKASEDATLCSSPSCRGKRVTSAGSLPKTWPRAGAGSWFLFQPPATAAPLLPPSPRARQPAAPTLPEAQAGHTGSGRLTCCSVIAIKCDSWGPPRAAHGFIYESGFEELGRGDPTSSHIPSSQSHASGRKGCSDFVLHMCFV